MSIPSFPEPQVEILDPFMELVARRSIDRGAVRWWHTLKRGVRQNPGIRSLWTVALEPSGVTFTVFGDVDVHAPTAADASWNLTVRVWVRFDLGQNVSEADVQRARATATECLETWWVETHLIGPEAPSPTCSDCILHGPDGPGRRIRRAAAEASVQHRRATGVYPQEGQVLLWAIRMEESGI